MTRREIGGRREVSSGGYRGVARSQSSLNVGLGGGEGEECGSEGEVSGEGEEGEGGGLSREKEARGVMRSTLLVVVFIENSCRVIDQCKPSSEIGH